MPPDYRGTIQTQASVESMAACISQATGVAPSQTDTGVVIDASATPMARRYVVAENDEGTNVLIVGAAAARHATTTDAATRCAVETATPPESAAK